MLKNLFILPLLLHLISIVAAQDQTLPDGQEIYQQLKDAELYPNQVASVQNLILKRDAGTFNFHQGKFYILQPVLGKVTGAVFIGEGIFQISPPTEIERYQLKKFTDSEILNARFSELYLRFTDSTFEELKSKLQFAAGEVEGQAKDIEQDCQKRALKILNKNLNARILEDLLFSGPINERTLAGGFFHVEIKTKDGTRFFFSLEPKEVEEVTLRREFYKPPLFNSDLICSFHKEGDYKNGRPEDLQENKDEILAKHYKMDVKLETNGMMEASCELTLIPLVDGIRAITFELYDTLIVNQVRAVEKDSLTELFFVKEKNRSPLTIIFPQPLTANQEKKILINYSGEILERHYYGLFFIKETESWYPRYGYLKRSTFDLTFQIPKGYKFICAGTKIKEWKEGHYLFTQWKEDFPTFLISFNLGYFDIHTEQKEGLPKIEVYWNDDFHNKIMLDSLKEENLIVTGKNMKKRVAADLLNSVNFFQNCFGSYPFDHLIATEIPYNHGQAFTGLLHLSWGTFQQESQFKGESFRAHEVSHHWWGDMVGWQTYHDQWLSEGFAKYSGAWYAQLSLKDNSKFFGELKFWRKNILEGHKIRESDGAKAGPLWLGTRLNSSKSLDYYTLIYEKGAFVLHMLRNMLMDFKTFSDDKFIVMLKDFVSTYYGKNASTADFQKIAEKHFGEDMDWFFKQWVYGIEIPKYTYSYSTEKVGDKYEVTLKVRQENVSPDFKMQVPVVVVYKPEGYSVFRIWVDKPEVEVKLPPVPMEVKEIVFNPFESVLAEVEEK